MARGSNAKNLITNKIAAAFGEDFIGEVDKKLYVWADDGGERVQIAIAMTCPKNPVGATSAFAASPDEGPAEPVAAEISAEERATVAELMKKLGL